MGAREARRLINEFDIKRFNFHPIMLGFYPNDLMAYELYEVIAENQAIALFHNGQTGVGSGMWLTYSNRMYMDDVAVDFPGMKIILDHPSFP